MQPSSNQIVPLLFLLLIAGCSAEPKDPNEGLVLHYIDLGNKTLPSSFIDSKPLAILNDISSRLDAVETPEERENLLAVFDKALLLQLYVDVTSSHFTAQHLIADAEVNKSVQLDVDSTFVEARKKIGGMLDNELIVLDEYLLRASDESLRKLLVRLKEATTEVREMISDSSSTKLYD